MTTQTPAAAAAGTWRLGDLTVNRLGFGAMRLTGSTSAPASREQSIAVLRRAVELGVNHIDTAEFYFSPPLHANELIHDALSPYPDDLVIATKVGPGRDASGEWLPRATPDQLRGQVEENLRQLGREHMDVVYYRSYPADDISGHVAALAELRDAGLIRHIGVSAIEPEHLAQALAITPVVCVQNRYSIDSCPPGTDEVRRLCGEQGIAFVPFFAIAGEGRDRDTSAEKHEEVAKVARAHDATAAQVRLAWTLHQGRHVLAIPGTGNPAHLEENVAAAALHLTGDELDRLAAVSQPKGSL